MADSSENKNKYIIGAEERQRDFVLLLVAGVLLGSFALAIFLPYPLGMYILAGAVAAITGPVFYFQYRRFRNEHREAVRTFFEGQDEWPAACISWLAEATNGLGALAKRRIANEISGHFTDAYTEALSNSATPDEAKQTAISALGDPQKARRAFRKVYLTERDENALRRLDRQKQKLRISRLKFLLIGVLLINFSLVISYIDMRGPYSDFMIYQAFFFNGLALIEASLFRLLEQNRFRTALLSSNVFTMIVFGITATLFAMDTDRTLMGVIMVFSLVLVITQGLRQIVRAPKFPARLTDEELETLREDWERRKRG